VDLLIQDDKQGTLLTWRQDRFGSGWHIPGGIIRYKETIAQRIGKVARLELGAIVNCQPTPVTIHQFIEPKRKERGHFISLLYRCQLMCSLDPSKKYVSGNMLNGQWKWHKKYPEDMLRVQAPYRIFIEGKGDCDDLIKKKAIVEF
jgi:colanic acid biosynthesis protein WcaH